MLKRAGMGSGLIGEFVDIEERRVRQRVGLEPGPQVFERIEFGGIRRQELGPDIGLRSEERLHDASPVRLPAIPDQDPRCIPLPIELAEKVADGRQAQCGNGRDFLIRARPLLEHGRDAARMPGAPYQRRHQQTGFVDEDEPGPPARGVFFTRGQSVLPHCFIAVSSRSMARRVVFCGLQPMLCSSRPM